MEKFVGLVLLMAVAAPVLVAGDAKSYAPPAPDGAVAFGAPPKYADNIWSESHPGYAVQTGYEGYLIPAESLSIKDIIKTAGFVAALPILGKIALKLVVKVGVALIGVGLTLAAGVILTWALCTFTSVCTLTLHKLEHFKWHKWGGRSLSSDTLTSATEFLTSAISKYSALNAPQPSDH